MYVEVVVIQGVVNGIDEDNKMFSKYNKEQLIMIKEIIESLLEISSASIIKNNFIKAFYTNTVEGRLRGTYNLFGAISFRLTSQSPKLNWALYA